jgi:hypothetical protein
VTRIFIAIAAAAIAFVPSAHATVQTVEADNGAVFEILWTSRSDPSGTNGAAAQILTPDHETVNMMFNCRGQMMFPEGLRAIPPRSVAGRIAQIACTGAMVKNYSEPWHSADPRDKR